MNCKLKAMLITVIILLSACGFVALLALGLIFEILLLWAIPLGLLGLVALVFVIYAIYYSIEEMIC